MQVPRSVQSVKPDSFSAPITRAFLYIPWARYACAVFSARRDPVQAPFRSKQVAFSAPSRSCTPHATQGMISVGEMVATRIRSISSAFISASSRAFNAAPAAIVTVSSSSFAICLCTTPVLSRIHWSLVSTIFARSLLSHTLSGAHEPVPHILPVIFFSMISVLNQSV